MTRENVNANLTGCKALAHHQSPENCHNWRDKTTPIIKHRWTASVQRLLCCPYRRPSEVYLIHQLSLRANLQLGLIHIRSVWKSDSINSIDYITAESLHQPPHHHHHPVHICSQLGRRKMCVLDTDVNSLRKHITKMKPRNNAVNTMRSHLQPV